MAIASQEQHKPINRFLTMPPQSLPQRVFRISRRSDGRFECRNETPGDSPLGVDYSLSQAIGTATREATAASRDGCRVIIKAQQPNGTWKKLRVIEPPGHR
jgi:hypothetical protein